MQSSTYYQHLHAFRGFAILNIVAAHCWTILIFIAKETPSNTPQDFLTLYAASETFFHNATIYFAVISGVLFSLIFKTYTWKKFYFGKLKHVVAPYLVFTLFYAFISGMLMVEPNSQPLTINEVLNTLPRYILTGQSFAHMWYIPVLVVLFILTPLFSKIINHKSLLPVLIGIVIAPLLVSRSWPDFVWENFVFFFGPYILGMYVGQQYTQALAFIDRFIMVLCTLAGFTCLLLGYLYWLEYEPVAGVKLQESVGYVNKLCIALIAINILHKNEHKLPQFLCGLADHSFSIYFVHMFFTAVFGFIMIATGLIPMTISGIAIGGLLLFPITILTSVGFTKLVKKVVGKHSRWMIGS